MIVKALVAAGTALLLAAAPDRAAEIEPVVDADYYKSGRFPAAQVELGRLLFFDKILSGNRNIACATCHHPKHATGWRSASAKAAWGSGVSRAIRPRSPILAPRSFPACSTTAASRPIPRARGPAASGRRRAIGETARHVRDHLLDAHSRPRLSCIGGAHAG